jgi:lysophospholipase L1-like esterase
MRNRLANAAVLLGSLLLMELTLRVWDPIGLHYLSDVRRYAATRVPSADFWSLHGPGTSVTVRGIDYRFNARGLRGGEVAVPKPAGRTRVMILGDSVVLGWGVEEDSLFIDRLQRRIDPTAERIELIGAGCGEWNTRNEWEWLRTRGFDLEPDAVLLVVVNNDLDPKTTGRTAVPREELLAAERSRGAGLFSRAWGKLARRTYLGGYAQYIRKASGTRARRAAMPADDDPRWVDARMALDDMVAACAQRGVAFSACLYTHAEGVAAQPVLEKFRAHLEGSGVTPVFMPERLFDKRYRLSVVDTHANAAGHGLMGDALEPAVRALVRRRGAAADAGPGSERM